MELLILKKARNAESAIPASLWHAYGTPRVSRIPLQEGAHRSTALIKQTSWMLTLGEHRIL
jgi:hypothetical protein